MSVKYNLNWYCVSLNEYYIIYNCDKYIYKLVKTRIGVNCILKHK